MSEKQLTFGATVGLDKMVPTARLDSDLVECSDGSMVCHADVWYDCKGGAHSNESDRHDADVAIVSELLDGVGKWSDEYCTENTDYPNGFPLGETSHDWGDRIGEWLEGMFDDPIHSMIRTEIVDRIDEMDAEPQYHPNEYAGYSGPGCCLFSFDIGEYEEQVDITCHAELLELHNRGDLNDVLDDVNCDVYVSRSKRREKNESTGYYECVGRETYDPYGRGDTTFEVYTNPGGQWQFVVSKERMKELLTDAIVECARRIDSKG